MLAMITVVGVTCILFCVGAGIDDLITYIQNRKYRSINNLGRTKYRRFK